MGTVIYEKDIEGTTKTSGGWERLSKILISEHHRRSQAALHGH